MKKKVLLGLVLMFGAILIASTSWAECTGCTPGYWKQDHHFGNWVDFDPGQSVDNAFSRCDLPELESTTLLQALNTGGGGSNALLRHATAALLNASNGDVNYSRSVTEIIDKFCANWTAGTYGKGKNYFEEWNERRCPLGRAEAE